MTENQDELKELYNKLLDEVLESADSSGKGRKENGSITAKSAQLIEHLIKKITGQLNIVTERTVRDYYRNGYKASHNRIGVFAAVALVRSYKGALSDEDCRSFYSTNPASSPVHWNQYIELAKAPKPEQPPELQINDSQWQKEKNSFVDPLNIFHSPDFENILQRPEVMDMLYNKICRHRLVVVDGLAGCGKKHVIKTLEKMLLEKAKYNRVWWVELHKKYTLNNFFDELPFDAGDSVKGITNKYRWFEEKLKSNRILIVFCELEVGELETFAPLIKRTFDKTGDCMYLVLRNSMSLFPEIPLINQLKIPPFSRAEIKNFLETDDHKLSEKELASIEEMSGGWPFYLQALKHKGNDKAALKRIQKNPHLLTAELVRWYNLWEGFLDENDRTLLQVLHAYVQPILYADLLSLANKVGISQLSLRLQVLENAHLLIKYDSGFLALTPMGEVYAKSKPDDGQGAQIHENICEIIKANLPLEPSRNFEGDELDIWIKVIGHEQKAGFFEQSASRINQIKGAIKRRNRYPILIKLLCEQFASKMPQQHWLRFDLAHAYFLTGEYEKSLIELDECIAVAKKWFRGDARDPDGISYFLKVIQLFAELCSAVGRNKEAISILSNGLSLFDYSDMHWSNRCQTIGILSQFYEREGNYQKSLQMNKNLLQGNYGHPAVLLGVTCMRMALVQRKIKSGDPKTLLARANRLFRGRDVRALAWSETILALDQLNAGKIQEAKRLIKTVIHAHVEGALANDDYRQWLTILQRKPQLADLRPFIESELARLEMTQIDPAKEWLKNLDQKIKLLVEWLQFRANFFDIDSFIKPLRGNEIPKQSVLLSSLEQHIRRRPLHFLVNIAAMSPSQLFTDSDTTQQVALCATDVECQQFIKRQIIVKHFAILCDADYVHDDTRVEYGSILFRMGECELALKLLDKVHQDKRRFNYVMLKADCQMRCKQFDHADNLYEALLEGRSNNVDRATVLFKRATLVIEARESARFQDALSWVQEALELYNDDENFVTQVENGIIFLTIETTPLESLELQIQKLIYMYSITLARGESIVQSIFNITKRRRLKNILPLYAK